jgi:hypothetical protein
MQQALRWWCNQEAIDRATHADHIQNQILQDLFALRLSVQAFSGDRLDTLEQQQQVWLTTTEHIHQQLNQLSLALVPAYLTESLPLAIQSSLKQWQIYHPHCPVQLDLPDAWPQETFERNHLILVTLKILLQQVIPVATPDSLQISLGDRAHNAVLSIKITYGDPLALKAATRAQELTYLYRCFRCLLPGRCFYHRQGSQATWHFEWRRSLNGP